MASPTLTLVSAAVNTVLGWMRSTGCVVLKCLVGFAQFDVLIRICSVGCAYLYRCVHLFRRLCLSSCMAVVQVQVCGKSARVCRV